MVLLQALEHLVLAASRLLTRRRIEDLLFDRGVDREELDDPRHGVALGLEGPVTGPFEDGELLVHGPVVCEPRVLPVPDTCAEGSRAPSTITLPE